MNEVTVKIVCDSTNALQTRLTTFQVRVPKFLLQEIARHRVFSLCFNSARAIPAKTMRQSADFEPREWLSNKPGMVGGAELVGFRLLAAKLVWRSLNKIDKFGHYLLQLCGLHKQYTNRWLETIVWVDGVITSTDWDNFLKLRNHPDAQPEIKELAAQIEHLLKTNSPDYLEEGEWHLPYIDDEDVEEYSIDKLRLISAGRCARVSYGFKDTKDGDGDLRRADKLLNSNPKHVSPAEHVAMAPYNHGNPIGFKSGNFRNWVQFRQILDSEMPI